MLVSQTYSDADTIAHARHMAPIFADPRYIRVSGRPVFAVYNADDLPDPNRWTDLFRDASLNMGFQPYLIRVERQLDRDKRPPEALGFDAALDFQPFSRNFQDWQETRPELKRRPGRRISNRLRREMGRLRDLDTHHDMAAYVDFDVARPAPGYIRFPGVCPSWDNSARRPTRKGIIFRNTAPALFERWVAAKTQDFVAPSGEENLFFVNAWNEWAEGCHLEPCRRYGYDWLRSLERGLARKSPVG